MDMDWQSVVARRRPPARAPPKGKAGWNIFFTPPTLRSIADNSGHRTAYARPRTATRPWFGWPVRIRRWRSLREHLPSTSPDPRQAEGCWANRSPIASTAKVDVLCRVGQYKGPSASLIARTGLSGWLGRPDPDAVEHRKEEVTFISRKKWRGRPPNLLRSLFSGVVNSLRVPEIPLGPRLRHLQKPIERTAALYEFPYVSPRA